MRVTHTVCKRYTGISGVHEISEAELARARWLVHPTDFTVDDIKVNTLNKLNP